MGALREAYKMLQDLAAVPFRAGATIALPSVVDKFLEEVPNIPGAELLGGLESPALRLLNPKFLRGIKGIRQLTPHEIETFGVKGMRMPESGMIGLEKLDDIKTLIHEIAHNFWPNVSREDRTLLRSTLKSPIRGDTAELFGDAVEEFITNKKAFGKRAPTVQEIIEKYAKP